MNRRKLIAGNWKMNLVVPEGVSLAKAAARIAQSRSELDVLICPSYVCLCEVGAAIKGTNVKLGAQDVFWKESGAYTGKVSPKMLRDAGCEYCIVGHSEARGRFGTGDEESQFFCETDATVNKKITALLYCGICPILCVGETLAERESGHTETVIGSQIKGALEGLSAAELAGFAIAYEPVWAIGTGHACEPQEANRVCSFIRTTVQELLGETSGSDTRILYGGSVKAANSAQYLHQAEIDGALVGGASLDAEEFSKIVLSA